MSRRQLRGARGCTPYPSWRRVLRLLWHAWRSWMGRGKLPSSNSDKACPNHPVTKSLRHCVTASLCHCVTLSLCHCVETSFTVYAHPASAAVQLQPGERQTSGGSQTQVYRGPQMGSLPDLCHLAVWPLIVQRLVEDAQRLRLCTASHRGKQEVGKARAFTRPALCTGHTQYTCRYPRLDLCVSCTDTVHLRPC